VTYAAPSGTVIEHTGSYVTKIVVETASSSGVTTSTQEFAINHPYTNITVTGTSDAVGVVTTTAGPDDEEKSPPQQRPQPQQQHTRILPKVILIPSELLMLMV
jgi:hypothetical protein